MAETKKSLRQFECPDEVWAQLEVLAREQEISINSLVTGAIRAYLRACSEPRPPQPLPMPCLSMGPGAWGAPIDRSVPSVKLVVAFAGVEHIVLTARFVIGSGPSCDLQLDGPDGQPERAMIEWLNGVYHFVDLGEPAGIYCNGQRVSRKRIDSGDEFVIGAHRLIVRVVAG